MRAAIRATAALCLLGAPAVAAPGFQRGATVRVSPPTVGRPVVEPHLSAHPTDGNLMLAAAMVVNHSHAPFETSRLSAFLSIDGGATWGAVGFSWFGYDPWTALRAQGPALLGWLGGTDPESGSRPIRLFRSTDGGARWSPDVETLAGEFDGVKLAVLGEDVLLAATSFVAGDAAMRSRVAVYRIGDRVGTPVFLDNGPPTRLAAQPAWVDFQRVVVATMSTPSGAGGPEAWAHLSRDGGRSFDSSVLVSRRMSAGLGYAQLAAGPAGSPASGRVVFVRALRPPHALEGVWANVSRDGGLTWSEERRVDRFPGGASPDVLVPSVAFAADGTLGISWVDRRDDPEGRRNRLYFAWSLDGGETFTAPIAVSDVDSGPATPENGATADLLAGGGHYLGLCALPNGDFQALWSDSRDGAFALYTARLRRTE